MTRDQFLEYTWQKYPAFTDLGTEWLVGRVLQVEGSKVSLAEETIAVLDGEDVHVPDLGANCPVSILRTGDWVAYSRILRKVFLLSPCVSGAAPLDRKEWQQFLRKTQTYFESLGFKQWLTPTLVPSAGVDANIDYFEARGVRTGRVFRLPTSPEFELKKALASGETKIFEMKMCMRDDDDTAIHHYQFMMLEWYRAFCSLADLQEDILGLMRCHDPQLVVHPCFVSIPEAFRKIVGFDLQPNTSQLELQELLIKEQIDFATSDDWNDLFFRVYIARLEPWLTTLGFVFVKDFPPQQRSLARLTDAGWADRFELLWDGVEIANAYHEETNPDTIQQIVENEKAKRIDSGKSALTQDETFLATMRRGLPPCVGVALGLDRIYMKLTNLNNIFK
ncbi:MAG: hypothetical protein H6623_00375 [Bdellovibrionaceae bacterium]|nr:hypothetical protein [Pseudobdellovibrionaceae bacterium]